MSGVYYFLLKMWPSKTWLPFSSVFAGIFLGIAFLTKGLSLMALPSVIILSYISIKSNTGNKKYLLLKSLVPSLIGLIIGGWWYLRNIFFLGKLQLSLHGSYHHAEKIRHENYDFFYFFENFFIRLTRTFWDRAARFDVALPNFITDLLTLFLVVIIIFAFLLRQAQAAFCFASPYPLNNCRSIIFKFK